MRTMSTPSVGLRAWRLIVATALFIAGSALTTGGLGAALQATLGAEVRVGFVGLALFGAALGAGTAALLGAWALIEKE